MELILGYLFRREAIYCKIILVECTESLGNRQSSTNLMSFEAVVNSRASISWKKKGTKIIQKSPDMSVETSNTESTLAVEWNSSWQQTYIYSTIAGENKGNISCLQEYRLVFLHP